MIRNSWKRTLCAHVLVAFAAASGVANAQEPAAVLVMQAPAAQEFVLEATVPVPKGTYLPGQTMSPLAVRDVDGSLVPTQVEVVTRYPDSADGADVIEVLARVTRPSGASVGQDIEYDLVPHPHDPGAFQMTAAVHALLSTPGSLQLTARDQFNNMYRADLLDKVRRRDPSLAVMRSGSQIQETRTHEVMLPTSSASTDPATAPYPHLLGVHGFVRTYANEDFVVLDLLFHNGMSGFDSAPDDDPVHDLYFNQLDLVIPAGWSMGWAINNPAMGRVNPAAAGASSVALIDAQPGGRLHFVPQQAQFPRRLVLARGSEALARGIDVVLRRTRGFCQAGPTPSELAGGARDLWSWWSPSTPRFLTSNARLPHLDHVSLGSVRSQISSRFQAFRHQTETGAAGGYPTMFPLLGWAQPWGVQYGGMTGGDEIEMLPEVDSAWSRHHDALRWLDLRSKAYVERHPIAHFEIDGRPPLLEDHLVNAGQANSYLPTFMYLDERGQSDYFGFKSTSLRFAEAAYITGRLPWYKKDLEDFQEIDFQHYTRYLNPHLGLIWLANDSLARLQIELSSALVRLSFHEHRNSQYGHVQGTGLLKRMIDVDENPGQGANFGRGPAWAMVAALTQYALADDVQRQRMRPWFARIADTARQGQSLCTGNPSALPIDRNFKGAYQSRQSFEVGFFLNAAHGMRTTVFADVDAARATMLGDYVAGGAYSCTMAPYWNPSAGGQVSLIAVRPKNNVHPEFCLNIPENGIPTSYFVDHTTAMPAWAYAFADTQDGLFLQRAGQSLGGANLQTAIEAMGLTQLHETAPILSLLQEL